ncbi:MAG: radical SAM family RiPP maturation amino acid epimerase [Rhodospirillaceae bacterium]
MKRFLERCLAQPVLIERARLEPAVVAAEAGVVLDPKEFQAVWDIEYAVANGEGAASPLTREYQGMLAGRLAYRDGMRETCGDVTPRYATWRRRQMARAELELGPGAVDAIVHSNVSIELSQGCSGGCWFCGLAAPRLSGVHPYTEETGRAWRELLAGLRRTLGPGVRHGFCYWATDPLDNPDYEKFCCDFHDVLGVFPQFTTALALRDVERTRRLLHLAEERQGAINRFSVLSTAQLDKVHAAFSAEELILVECVPQNPESRVMLAPVGRARNRSGKARARKAPSRAQDLAVTIACVSGFLINMVERTVKLISPCPASERWPLGYRLWVEAGFADVDTLLGAVQSMIDDQMRQSVAELPVVAFNDSITFAPLAGGFKLASKWAEIRYTNADPANPTSAYLRELGQMVVDGVSGADAIALVSFYRHGVPTAITLHWLESLFGKGLLREQIG